VVRLPPGSNWNKMDVKLVLRMTLKASYIPLCVCDFLLENLRVIKQVPPSVGKMLDNCRQWTSRINDNLPTPCGCAAFQWLPKRHGHVYCPSLAGAWLRWLPSSLLPGIRGLDLLGTPRSIGKSCFSLREVSMCKKFLSPMVVTPIDKCNQCSLIW